MQNILALATVAEAGTELLLLVWPAIVVRLLFAENGVMYE